MKPFRHAGARWAGAAALSPSNDASLPTSDTSMLARSAAAGKSTTPSGGMQVARRGVLFRGDLAVPLVHASSTAAFAVVAALALAACNSETETMQKSAAEHAASSAPVSQAPRPSSPTQQAAPEPPSYDGTLVAMVESAIAAEPKLNTLGIDVSAAGGTVYLRGEARSRDARQLATEVASEVDGVKKVQNELLVKDGS
jgi:osmotically-inducible protein OsmY